MKVLILMLATMGYGALFFAHGLELLDKVETLIENSIEQKAKKK